jgi:hypothetical protein
MGACPAFVYSRSFIRGWRGRAVHEWDTNTRMGACPAFVYSRPHIRGWRGRAVHEWDTNARMGSTRHSCIRDRLFVDGGIEPSTNGTRIHEWARAVHEWGTNTRMGACPVFVYSRPHIRGWRGRAVHEWDTNARMGSTRHSCIRDRLFVDGAVEPSTNERLPGIRVFVIVYSWMAG